MSCSSSTTSTRGASRTPVARRAHDCPPQCISITMSEHIAAAFPSRDAPVNCELLTRRGRPPSPSVADARLRSALHPPIRAVAMRARSEQVSTIATSDERAGPGLAVPVFVGRDRVRVDLHGERRDRLAELGREVRIVERREQQRRRFAGDACQREQDAGDNARQRRRQDDGENRARACRAERQRTLP